MLKSKLLWALALPLALLSVAAEAKLYKWVDENGETHYGEVIPPEYAGRSKVQIDNGMEVQQKAKPAKEQPKATQQKTPEQIEQERHDKALLATYANEAEIDDARDRNLQQVNTRMSGIEMQIKSAQEDLDGYMKEKAAADAAHKPIDSGLQAQINQASRRLERLNADLASAQAEADKIKARFDADKQRYRELTSNPPQ